MATPAQTRGHTQGGQGKLHMPVACGEMSRDKALVWGWLLPTPGELWWWVHVCGGGADVHVDVRVWACLCMDVHMWGYVCM